MASEVMATKQGNIQQSDDKSINNVINKCSSTMRQIYSDCII